uniref:Uncharacterized protein MANES_07G130200 n=1 Tax=Rhizophora mucronata TaxID=61149 RepID=A0A2P2JIF4_RHIMU
MICPLSLKLSPEGSQ